MKRFLKFFSRKISLAHVYSIPVRIDYRWFLVLAVMAWFIARTIPEGLVQNAGSRFVLGLITVLVFFASVFVHEFGHAYIARKEGIQVLEILLHPFGGLSRLRREPDSPGAEFRIAVAGPIASLILSAVFFALWAGSNYIGTEILSPLLFALFLLNLLLAIFNLFPGYPLDGGRVLRAVLWRRGKDLNDATVLTGKFGQMIAISLIVFGIAVIMVSGEAFTGLWTILVGVFLYDSAAKIINQVNNFENLVVEQVMEFPISIPPGTIVMDFIDRTLPVNRQVVFPIAESKRFYGFMLLDDVKKNLPKDKWRETEVKEVMRPIREDYFIESGSNVTDAIALLRDNGIGAVGVVDPGGSLIGVIHRGRIRRRS